MKCQICNINEGTIVKVVPYETGYTTHSRGTTRHYKYGNYYSCQECEDAKIESVKKFLKVMLYSIIAIALLAIISSREIWLN